MTGVIFYSQYYTCTENLSLKHVIFLQTSKHQGPQSLAVQSLDNDKQEK